MRRLFLLVSSPEDKPGNSLTWSLLFSVIRFVVSGGQRQNVSTHTNRHTRVPSNPRNRPSRFLTSGWLFPRGENVEEAFLEAAKRIYQNIQDGSLDLNAAESGVQHKPSAPQGGRLNADSQPVKEGCSC